MSDGRERVASEDAHRLKDIQSMFRQMLAAFANNQYAILPLAVIAMVGAGALFQLDVSKIPNDEIWEIQSIHGLVRDSFNTTGFRSMDIQMLYTGKTMGSTGVTQLANGTNTIFHVFGSSQGFSNFTTVSDSLAVWQGQATLNKQVKATMPYMELMTTAPWNVALVFTASSTMAVVEAYVIVKRRRRMQPLEIYN